MLRFFWVKLSGDESSFGDGSVKSFSVFSSAGNGILLAYGKIGMNIVKVGLIA